MLNIYETGAERRSKSGPLLGSVAIHLALALILFQVRTIVPPSTSYAVTQLYLPPADPAPAAPPEPRKIAPPPLIAPRLSTPVAQMTATHPAEDLPAPPELRVVHPEPPPLRPAPSPIPPSPQPPPPVFASAASAAPAAPPVKPLLTGGFGAIPPTAPPVAAPKLPAATGAFGAVPADPPRHTASTTANAPSGFGTAAVNAPNAPRATNTAPSSGFGSASAAAAESPQPKPKPAATGFGAAVAADPARQSAAPPKVASEPLEILYKPRPSYTDEARRARIEGDVVLEVLFPAAGPLRVQRVVQSLGYGLDQNAMDAASKIRFRQATQNGHAVDTVANVRISFQMAY